MNAPKTFLSVDDPYASADEKGWRIVDAAELNEDLILEADVVIVGTGSGGSTTASVLSAAGLKTVILEEGPLKSSDKFDMDERAGYRDLYQEGALRTSKDGAILLAQGRNVGGGTTVNWCSSFRTPEQTLSYWKDKFGVEGLGAEDLIPFFEEMEERLNILEWMGAPNPNNQKLKDGAAALDYGWGVIPRNVSGCADLGYCGVGCPVNAKQSTLVSMIPDALDNGATLVHRAAVERISIRGRQVDGVEAMALGSDNVTATGTRILVKARYTVVAGGAINTPGLLLRSNVPDPYKIVGKRTFIHPVITSFARFEERIDPYYGAPQSIYSDQFTWPNKGDDRIGFKLEAMPLLPGVFSTMLGVHGNLLRDSITKLPYTQATMAILRDGFHEDSQGGQVELDEFNRPVLDYSVSDYVAEGIRRALETNLRIQFAAGATEAKACHTGASWHTSFEGALAELEGLAMTASKVGISSAHLMGGCAMGHDVQRSVTDSSGKYRGLENLSIHDGSLFPTSLGANPQLTIFALTYKLASELADELVSKGS